MKALMLYQYAYYWMLEIDKYGWRGKLSASVTKSKAFIAFAIVETCALGAFYIFIANIMLGVPIHKGAYPPVIVFLIYVAAMVYVNKQLLGPSKRIEYYKDIFDGWDKGKRMRWKLYVILISVLAFVAFILAVQASRKMLQP